MNNQTFQNIVSQNLPLSNFVTKLIQAKMPKTEITFAEFWYRNQQILGPCQTQVAMPITCPFNINNGYNADFYLPNLNLYIEVKGQMTLHTINKLWYLLLFSNMNFYIWQATEEDWLGRCFIGKTAQIRKNINMQGQEILKASSSPQTLNKLCIKHLIQYISIRTEDLAKWI